MGDFIQSHGTKAQSLEIDPDKASQQDADIPALDKFSQAVVVLSLTVRIDCYVPSVF